MKTRKEEFFEKYPNAPRNDKGYPDGCIISLYPNKHCIAKSCEICWDEMSENYSEKHKDKNKEIKTKHITVEMDVPDNLQAGDCARCPLRVYGEDWDYWADDFEMICVFGKNYTNCPLKNLKDGEQ